MVTTGKFNQLGTKFTLCRKDTTKKLCPTALHEVVVDLTCAVLFFSLDGLKKVLLFGEGQIQSQAHNGLIWRICPLGIFRCSSQDNCPYPAIDIDNKCYGVTYLFDKQCAATFMARGATVMLRGATFMPCGATWKFIIRIF